MLSRVNAAWCDSTKRFIIPVNTNNNNNNSLFHKYALRTYFIVIDMNHKTLQ